MHRQQNKKDIYVLMSLNTILLQVTHWQSPHFHAYFPAANSYPAIVGEILNTGIACLGFNWVSTRWHQYCGVFKHRNVKLQRNI